MSLFQRRHALQLIGTVLMAGALLPGLSASTASVASSATAPRAASAAHETPPLHERARAHRSAALTPAAASILFAIAHRTADASQASALFAPKSWYSPPPPPPQAAPPPASAPTAPPLPFAFLGRYTDGSNVTVYFVTRDDRVYDVKPGDVIDAIYSVETVENGQLNFLYKPLNVRQSMPIGDVP